MLVYGLREAREAERLIDAGILEITILGEPYVIQGASIHRNGEELVGTVILAKINKLKPL